MLTVKSLLEQAAKCNTKEAAQLLLGTLQDAFFDTHAFGNFEVISEEAYLENQHMPNIQFEVRHFISDHYVIVIRPELREAKFDIRVSAVRLRDGLGADSNEIETLKDMDTYLEPVNQEIEIDELTEKVKKLAIEFHAKLIEQVGVSRHAAVAEAEGSW